MFLELSEIDGIVLMDVMMNVKMLVKQSQLCRDRYSHYGHSARQCYLEISHDYSAWVDYENSVALGISASDYNAQPIYLELLRAPAPAP
jgi:hypothetical protein